MKSFMLGCLVLATWCCLASPSLAEELAFEKIDRRIKSEPKYESQPRYILLLVGAEERTPVWIVQDGERLYIDKNANRDLTDDGPPIVATKKRMLGANSWDRNYLLDSWKLPGGAEVRDFNLRNWNYADEKDSYGLSLTVDGKVPMYALWFDWLATSPKEAPIIHFGGPVEPRILRSKEFVLGARLSRFSVAFTTARDSKLSPARLSIEAFPLTYIPTAVIDWPVKPGDAPLQTTHSLTERCCYWEFYTLDFPVPERAAAGTAVVTVSVPQLVFPLELSSDKFEVPVVDK